MGVIQSFYSNNSIIKHYNQQFFFPECYSVCVRICAHAALQLYTPRNFVSFFSSSACFNKAVIQNPFSNGGSPGGETVGGETRFAYFPAATVSDGTATAVSVQAATDATLAPAAGLFTHQNPMLWTDFSTQLPSDRMRQDCNY